MKNNNQSYRNPLFPDDKIEEIAKHNCFFRRVIFTGTTLPNRCYEVSCQAWRSKKSMISLKQLMTIFLSSLALLILAGQGFAQKQKIAQATIPFEFWIEGYRLPAGDYQIERLESTSYLLFRSTDGKIVQVAYTLPLDEDPAKDGESKLVFRIQNGRNYLYGGWGPSGRRVLTVESVRPVPSGDSRAEVPIIYR